METVIILKLSCCKTLVECAMTGSVCSDGSLPSYMFRSEVIVINRI